MRVLFVCLGNICRSPTAEGVMRALVRERGAESEIEIDSAGTGAWHVGSAPDRRATEAALGEGIVLESIARQVGGEDFERFDLILAMDRSNLRDLRRLAPPSAHHKLRLLREFDPEHDGTELDVPDPYYGGEDGFREVLALVRRACERLLEELLSGAGGAASALRHGAGGERRAR